MIKRIWQSSTANHVHTPVCWGSSYQSVGKPGHVFSIMMDNKFKPTHSYVYPLDTCLPQLHAALVVWEYRAANNNQLLCSFNYLEPWTMNQPIPFSPPSSPCCISVIRFCNHWRVPRVLEGLRYYVWLLYWIVDSGNTIRHAYYSYIAGRCGFRYPSKFYTLLDPAQSNYNTYRLTKACRASK